MIIAIDYGESKLGFAAGDEETKSTRPLEVIRRKGEYYADILKIVSDWQPNTLLFGLPKENLDDPDNQKVYDFAQNLQQLIEKELDISPKLSYYPELYSTKLANQGNSRKDKQQMGDANSAAFILGRWLEATGIELMRDHTN